MGLGRGGAAAAAAAAAAAPGSATRNCIESPALFPAGQVSAIRCPPTITANCCPGPTPCGTITDIIFVAACCGGCCCCCGATGCCGGCCCCGML